MNHPSISKNTPAKDMETNQPAVPASEDLKKSHKPQKTTDPDPPVAKGRTADPNNQQPAEENPDHATAGSEESDPNQPGIKIRSATEGVTSIGGPSSEESGIIGPSKQPSKTGKAPLNPSRADSK